MIRAGQKLLSLALAYAPLLLYLAVAGVFARLSSDFLTVQNFIHILVQSSAVAVAAVGMTFVLLTAGIDLSVGSIMFVTSAIAGTLVVRLGWPVAPVLAVALLAGLACGLINGMFITRLRMAPFIVTLAMLFVARGCGLWITQTRAINLPDTFRQLATARMAGIPSPVLITALVLAAAHLSLRRTVFGRQVYALGNDPRAAAKAGLPVNRILLRVYMISGACAAISGIITLAQLAAVSPNLGQGRELDVIAAAVLGGTSLFGGRGSALGSVMGAIMVETIGNGLNVIDADPYMYPVITGILIFAAVLLDSVRHQRTALRRRRYIRTPTAPGESVPPVEQVKVHAR